MCKMSESVVITVKVQIIAPLIFSTKMPKSYRKWVPTSVERYLPTPRSWTFTIKTSYYTSLSPFLMLACIALHQYSIASITLFSSRHLRLPGVWRWSLITVTNWMFLYYTEVQHDLCTEPAATIQTDLPTYWPYPFDTGRPPTCAMVSL